MNSISLLILKDIQTSNILCYGGQTHVPPFHALLNANTARDVYAVPATGCGVEREFSMSGNIFNKLRNRLLGKTIADIMQYKHWVANTCQSVIIEEDAQMIDKKEV
jgi:hAT family C-terminal dimerisation region